MKKLSMNDQLADLENFLQGFMRRPVALDPRFPEIRMDVREGEETYTIHAEIPGARKEDVKVDVDDNYVSIAAQIGDQSVRRNGDRWICSERAAGSVSRSITLPHDVDPAKASAAYENGVLALTLPKKKRTAARSLALT